MSSFITNPSDISLLSVVDSASEFAVQPAGSKVSTAQNQFLVKQLLDGLLDAEASNPVQCGSRPLLFPEPSRREGAVSLTAPQFEEGATCSECGDVLISKAHSSKYKHQHVDVYTTTGVIRYDRVYCWCNICKKSRSTPWDGEAEGIYIMKPSVAFQASLLHTYTELTWLHTSHFPFKSFCAWMTNEYRSLRIDSPPFARGEEFQDFVLKAYCTTFFQGGLSTCIKRVCQDPVCIQRGKCTELVIDGKVEAACSFEATAKNQQWPGNVKDPPKVADGVTQTTIDQRVTNQEVTTMSWPTMKAMIDQTFNVSEDFPKGKYFLCQMSRETV